MVMLGDPQNTDTISGEAVAERGRVEWPFRVELLFLIGLVVDERYQRPLQERFVQQIADDFDETLVGAIDVSARSDGTYAILDGQQRYWGMTRKGKTTVWSAVFEGMELEDEAGFFYRKNKDRKAMRGFYGFRARAVAGEMEAVQIDEAIRAEGFQLGPAADPPNGVIGAIHAVERAWQYTSEHRNESLTPALRTIRENYRGREGSFDAPLIQGLARFWQAFHESEVDQEALVAVLEEAASPKNLVGLGRQRLVEMPQGTTLPFAIADYLVYAFNRRKRAGRQGGTFPGKLDSARIQFKRQR